MMNVLSTMADTAKNKKCEYTESCECSLCAREKKLQALGFTKESIRDFIEASGK